MAKRAAYARFRRYFLFDGSFGKLEDGAANATGAFSGAGIGERQTAVLPFLSIIAWPPCREQAGFYDASAFLSHVVRGASRSWG
jgi:hypothetical protein